MTSRDITLDPESGEFAASILCTDTDHGIDPVRVTEWFALEWQAERFARTRYWVLVSGGYPDTYSNYMAATSLEHAKELARRYYDGYSDFAGVFIYSGARAPWTEQDPYPDYILEQGPRGGIRLERA